MIKNNDNPKFVNLVVELGKRFRRGADASLKPGKGTRQQKRGARAESGDYAS